MQSLFLIGHPYLSGTLQGVLSRIDTTYIHVTIRLDHVLKI